MASEGGTYAGLNPSTGTSTSTTRVVLVAVDASKESNTALTWALENVLTSADSVHLVHAKPARMYHIAPFPGAFVARETFEQAQKEEGEELMSRLEAARQTCLQHKVNADIHVLHGEPGDAICDEVDRLKANLLVIGSHGYSTVKRALVGSVSAYCVHHASCPVLVVR